MHKEIDISNVPLTPRGKNYDFNSVQNYEFVRFDNKIKFRTSALKTDESYVSDNEIDLNALETDEEKVNAIIKSPMVEVRKKRLSCPSLTSAGEIRLNPKRKDLIETSNGCYHDYKFSRRHTISFMRHRQSITVNNVVRNLALPRVIIDNKENENIKKRNLEEDIQLLVAAMDNSQLLLKAEHKRLGDMINDWNYILEIEASDIPEGVIGEIKSAVGGLQILLNKRFKSTITLLELAGKFVDNYGEQPNDNERHYRAEDIYAFVDLLINEIKKVDVQFGKLLVKRDHHWKEPAIDNIQNMPLLKAPGATVIKEKRVVKLNNVKSRIDIKKLRAQFTQATNSSEDIPVDMCVKTNKESIPTSLHTPDLNVVDNMSTKTPTSNRKIGVRSKAVLKKVTGTPVHEDTPRPRRSTQSNKAVEFAVPFSTNVSMTRKGSKKRGLVNSSLEENIISDQNSSISIPPKKPRKSIKNTRHQNVF